MCRHERNLGPDDFEMGDMPVAVVPRPASERGIIVETTLYGAEASAFIAYARTHGLTLSQALAKAAREAMAADQAVSQR